MKELEGKHDETYPLLQGKKHQLSSYVRKSTKSDDIHVEKENLSQKELDKAHERISALEV